MRCIVIRGSTLYKYVFGCYFSLLNNYFRIQSAEVQNYPSQSVLAFFLSSIQSQSPQESKRKSSASPPLTKETESTAMMGGDGGEPSSLEPTAPQQGTGEMITSDYYQVKNIPERFNHPGQLSLHNNYCDHICENRTF